MATHPTKTRLLDRRDRMQNHNKPCRECHPSVTQSNIFSQRLVIVDIDGAMKVIMGSARSMGIEIKDQ